MAGTNSPSVLWVAGEPAGKNVAGNITSIPEDITASGVSGLASLGYVNAVAASIDALHTRLVASGILES